MNRPLGITWAWVTKKRPLESVKKDGLSLYVTPSMCIKLLCLGYRMRINIETCSTDFYHIRNIRHIRKYLDVKSTETMVHAFITNKLDYCNSLLNGLPDCQIQKLQRVQNAAARIITGIKKYDHITPALKELHWLPVQQRIEFKILLPTYKALNNWPHLT